MLVANAVLVSLIGASDDRPINTITGNLCIISEKLNRTAIPRPNHGEEPPAKRGIVQLFHADFTSVGRPRVEPFIRGLVVNKPLDILIVVSIPKQEHMVSVRGRWGQSH